jgi:phosphatidylglycerol:prolipoprotein diacylglycerol transferase
VQKWEQFARPTLRETLFEIVKFSEGGLVVYGSFIGACIAAAVFLKRRKLPGLAMCDLFAPGMMLGVALGRIGCLMNGCCWAGECGDLPLGITFPQGSPPFMDQLEQGTLLDIRLERAPGEETRTITQVEPGSWAAQRGLKVGDKVVGIIPPRSEDLSRMRSGESVPDALLTLALHDGRRVVWEFRQLPTRSHPVYPIQVISSINALLICWFLWAAYPLRRRDGEVSALLLTIYPLTRFLIEIIRTDEPGLWQTNFTISQTVSIVMLVLMVPAWWFLLTRPRGSALPPLANRQATAAKSAS